MRSRSDLAGSSMPPEQGVRTERSLREQVLNEIHTEIVAGRAKSGTIYSVPGVATALGISTTPVREALLELSRIGLLAPMRNRGFRVVEPTFDDLNSLFDVREMLEVEAARRVAATPNVDAAALRPLADEIAAAVEAGDVRTYLEADREFHHRFVMLTGNRILTDMVMGLRDNMRLYGIDTAAGQDRQRASVREHYELIRLAEEGDAAAIAPLMRQHITSWKGVFSSGLRERTPAPPAGSGGLGLLNRGP